MPAPSVLTEEEKEHFLAHGWLKLSGVFTREKADDVIKDVWIRLGMSPTDKSTWTKPRIHMPSHMEFDARDFAPRAWDAICELCGGEDRITPETRTWRDSLIVNLGSAARSGQAGAGAGAGAGAVLPHELDNWHVDGDFFVHHLDSPEQGLLVIPLLTDVEPDGGGATVLCPQALPAVAAHLRDHPEGVSPRMVPRGRPGFARERGLDWFNKLAGRCDGFVEAAGTVGDVYLLHPLMLHSASANERRLVRIITNPPVSLREPFEFDRADGDFSLVERTTLRALGSERLDGWKITGPRERLVPERVRVQERMKLEEMERMKIAQKPRQVDINT